MLTLLWILAIFAVFAVLAYHQATISVWSIAGFIGLIFLSRYSNFHLVSLLFLWLIFLVPAVFLNIPALRKKYITEPIFVFYKKITPKMSATEREAIEAGTVKWSGELFSGKPNWAEFLTKKPFTLSSEEQAFLDGPTEELCKMLDDWDITHIRADIPQEVWQFLKQHGFFGMIIPKTFGGLEFSAAAHSAVISKVSGVSSSVATTIAVPNSLGPAELLLHYGTDEQRNYYLPRLAKGDEIPCFALTGPEAGSDASAMPDYGIVCHGLFNGENILGIKLSFNKRYITLAPVATVIGLAFKLYDPDHLIGQKKNIGITCALIPRETKGVSIGRRHFPVNMAFHNGPIQGTDVFIPLDYIIGGQKMAGKGWRMLVECLSVGRGITLPSISAGNAKMATLMSSAYSRIRKQFGISIANFEGIEEVLARMIGKTYFIDAMRKVAVAAIDEGEKPAVLTAISKYHTTERMRDVANDAMDIHGGKGICLGPNNYLGRGYQSVPVSITVEGANILTRSMIIFGQGAIRCHPYVLKEMEAAANPNKEQGFNEFDKAIISHIGFVISNSVRSFIFGLTNAFFVSAPNGLGKKYFQKLTRFSTVLALLSDISMMSLGGELKRKEKLSGRLGDILSLLFGGSAVLKRFYEQGQLAEEAPIIEWTLQETIFNMEKAVSGIIDNFPNPYLKWLLRVLIFPLGRCNKYPSDRLGKKIVKLFTQPSELRARMAKDIFLNKEGYAPFGRIEETFNMVIEAHDLENKLIQAKNEKKIDGITLEEKISEAIAQGIFSEAEAEHYRKLHQAKMDIIHVDDFDTKDLARH